MNGHFHGADPEAAIIEIATGRAVPAHLFFPPKEGALTSPAYHGGENRLYRDGYLVEFNPAANYCRAHVGAHMRELVQKASKIIGPKYRLAFSPTFEIDPRGLENAPADVQFFGCEPAMDAYSGRPTHVNLDGSVHPFRYAAGHLHISGPSVSEILSHEATTRLAAKMCDLYVALPLLALFPSKRGFLRRKYYGKAGEYRVQTYSDTVRGFEYRTPGAEIWGSMPSAGLAMGLLSWVMASFKSLAKTWDPTQEPIIQAAVNGRRDWRPLVPTNPRFYTPELLFRLANVFSDLSLGDTTHEFHSGWGEFVEHLGFKASP